MAECMFSRVPLEVAQEWIWYLDCWNLCAYRLTCKQAESQSFEIFAQRYFSTLKTSLMGLDIRRLEELSCSPRLRQYVKSIFFRDDCERNQQWTPYARDAGHIWPRDDQKLIQTSTVGVTTLRKILAECRLCPDSIKMRDCGRDYDNVDVEPLAELARLLYDTNLAITSLIIERISPSMAEARIELSKQHQGQGVAFRMLRCAKLTLTSKSKSYWTNEVLRSPSLADLTLEFDYPHIDDKLQSIFLTTTLSQLKRFCLCSATISGQLILTILANSKDTLTDLSFRQTTLRQGLKWRELFNKIGGDFPHLNSFRITIVRELIAGDAVPIKFDIKDKEELAEEYRAGLEFVLRNPNIAPRVVSWYYKGLNTGAFLEVMAAKAVCWK